MPVVVSKLIFSVPTFSPAPFADGPPGINNGNYMAVQAYALSTEEVHVQEILIEGQATSSAVMYMMFAFDGTTAGLPVTALAAPNSAGPMNASATALTLPVQVFIASGVSNPFRSSNVAFARLNLSFNGFGGIVEWEAAPGEDFVVSQSFKPEASLSNFTGGATSPIGASIVYEPV